MNRFLLAAAILAASAAPGAAAIVTVTDFTAVGAGITANPTSDLATAASVGVTTWMVNEVVDSIGGLGNGDILTMTNPIATTIAAPILISWDGGVFADSLITTSVNFIGDELDIVAHGILTGPGVPAGTAGVLDLAFTQAGGAGDLISGSGSFTATTGSVGMGTVPEPPTWAMLLVGFALMGGFVWRKSEAPRLTPLV
ncbi:MAG TPA: PEP-CTERM sorting domain-containing protein [Stellaceae bacterium]|jgi:hypothetical protein|nr:PEP-CTERM sorting domain-containing protein [Stellaceae bacterium]